MVGSFQRENIREKKEMRKEREGGGVGFELSTSGTLKATT